MIARLYGASGAAGLIGMLIATRPALFDTGMALCTACPALFAAGAAASLWTEREALSRR